MVDESKYEQAVQWLREADGLLITAGAGMGVDSGLPDFRGTEGFWRAYPALQQRGITFEEMANPAHFEQLPELAWGFYGHRLKLYRETQPHEGFAILRRWAARVSRGAFVFTSNVDGQFQKARFPDDRIEECHGTIHSLQCVTPCRNVTWPADGFAPHIDPATSTLQNALPRCPACGALARPNILMFSDYGWIEEPSQAQRARLQAWYASVPRVVVVELGAGKALPTVRRFGERMARHRLVRINAREAGTASQHGFGFEGGALEVLKQLDARLAGC
ncbi:NAD-dependent SIR2 family protein deacetylase [Paraburkholderia sp. GAS448]|uniref:SIR2 family NAD-dependent protein deacylase n=1 Tax=Paraburkholderia sp. GAS448 TaxID=3035136 RepID=UPI003D23B0EB